MQSAARAHLGLTDYLDLGRELGRCVQPCRLVC
jgi:hypothetical protein